jgi:hypothetical protein
MATKIKKKSHKKPIKKLRGGKGKDVRKKSEVTVIIPGEAKPVITVVNGVRTIDWQEAERQFVEGNAAISVRVWALKWQVTDRSIWRKLKECNWAEKRRSFQSEVAQILRESRIKTFENGIAERGEFAHRLGAHMDENMEALAVDAEACNDLSNANAKNMAVINAAKEAEVRLAPPEYEVIPEKEVVIQKTGELQKLIEDDKRESRTDHKREDD